VSVADEIAYLNNFIELNLIRDKDPISMGFKQEIQDPEQRIPPL
jgi:hypothetical protein